MFSFSDIDKRLFTSVELKNLFNKKYNKNYHSNAKLSVREVSSGIILPMKVKNKLGEYHGGVCDKNGNFLTGFRREKNKPGYFGSMSSYNFNVKEVLKSKETVIFGGVIIGHFGHLILEGFSRLWYPLTNITNYRIAFLPIIKNEKLFFDFFELFDLKDKVFFVEQPTQFDNIIVPDESIHSYDCYHNEFLIPYNYLITKIDKKYKQRIYLTHSKYKHGYRIVGERYFESFFEEQGYTIISPESLSIKDQISIIFGAQEIATTLGTLSHLALFSNELTKLYILMRVNNDFLMPQNIINQSKNIDWYYIDVSQNFLFQARSFGVSLIGNTKYWNYFTKQIFDIDNSQNTIKDNCYDYIKSFIDFYSHPHNSKKLEKLSIKNVLQQMYDVLIGGKNNIDICKNSLINNNEQTSIIGKYLPIFDHPYIIFKLHLSRIGWTSYFCQGLIHPCIFHNHFLEAVVINISDSNYLLNYSVLSDSGWSIPVTNNNIAGTVGLAKPIYGIRIELIHLNNLQQICVLYRLYSENSGWTEYKTDGEECTTDGNKVIGFEIYTTKKS